MKPETYWEERCSALEGLTVRLLYVLGQSQPMIQPHITELTRQWNSILDEIDKEYKK